MKELEQLERAILVHGFWKGRLREAISNGSSEFKPSIVRADDGCEFGKWLYGPEVTNHLRVLPEFQEIIRLHAEFHKVAAHILELAVSGKKEEAELAMAKDSEFVKLSSAIINKLTALMTLAA